MKLNKILVPTDFSKRADYALEWAVDMAKKSGAVVDLLHVVDMPVVGDKDYLPTFSAASVQESDDPDLQELYMLELIKKVKSLYRKRIELYKGIKIEEHILFDELQRRLSKFVVEQDTDLIVIGSKGDYGFHEFFVGSHAQKVIRFAKAPVITVKEKRKKNKVENLVFASEFQHVFPKAIYSLKNIIDTLWKDAHLHFVKVITPRIFEKDSVTISNIKTFVSEYGFENHQYTCHSYDAYSREEGICSFAEEINADIITLTTHGERGFKRAIIGSIAEKVVNHAIMPVLIFNEHI